MKRTGHKDQPPARWQASPDNLQQLVRGRVLARGKQKAVLSGEDGMEGRPNAPKRLKPGGGGWWGTTFGGEDTTEHGNGRGLSLDPN